MPNSTASSSRLGTSKRTSTARVGDSPPSPTDHLKSPASSDEEESHGAPKKKIKRGAKACTACRKVKMRCVGAEDGRSICNRCRDGGYECIFVESLRGRHGSRKADAMAASLAQMQEQLTTVLSSLSSTNHLVPPAPVLPALPSQPVLSYGGMEAPRYANNVSDERSNGVFDPLGSRRSSLSNPLGLLAEAISNQQASHSAEMHESPRDPIDAPSGSGRGSMSARSFKIGQVRLPVRSIPAEPKVLPSLLVDKIINSEEAGALFKIFFDHCKEQAPFLDRGMHTPAATAFNSPFLFTCICTVASRYYLPRPDLYVSCLRIANRLAGDNLASGSKSISIIQGYLLLAHWNQPAPSHASEEGIEDRTFGFAGIALRMAVELGFHVKTLLKYPPGTSEEVRLGCEKDMRNQERTWIHCVVSDQSLSMQKGKPASLSREDYLIRNTQHWHRLPASIPSDIGLCGISKLHSVVLRTLDAIYSDPQALTGLNESADYPQIVRGFLAQIDQWRMDWIVSIPADRTDSIGDAFRVKMAVFYSAYYRLFILSFAVQHALDKADSATDLAWYTTMCYDSAETIVGITRDFMGPKGLLTYGIDSTYVYIAYAACFLLKLVHPTFSHLVDAPTAISLVRDAASTLESSAIDSTHTPAQYAAFLRALIDSKLAGERTEMGTRVGSPAVVVEREVQFGTLDDMLDDLPGSEEGVKVDVGFWDNMLMPGYGAAYGTLSGGGSTMYSNYNLDAWTGFTTIESRPASPSAAFTFFGTS